ncbi:MAG: pyridoxal phosphate-dependent aminotransferase [Ornithinimicrobium sp.]
MRAPIARVAGLSTSVIRSFAAQAPAENISLALGEPGWALPDPAREALQQWAAASSRCSYGPNQGIPELLSAVGDQTGASSEEILVASGSQAALFAVVTAHVEMGDVVAVPDPGFPAYRTLVHLAGGTALTYPLTVDGSLDPATLIEALDRHTHGGGAPVRMLVLNHPSNPTGGGASHDGLVQVARACEDRDIIVLSDEVYRELHSGRPQPSLRHVTDAGVVTESVSKAWAAPGLRVGWAIGPPHLLAPARLVHNAMTTAPARPSQVAAAALLRASEHVLAHSRAELDARWDLVDRHAPSWMRGLARPAAGFYLWAPVPAVDVEPGRWAGGLRDHGGVTVVPGSAFGSAGAGYIRISVGGPRDELVEGLRRVDAYARASGGRSIRQHATAASAPGGSGDG